MLIKKYQLIEKLEVGELTFDECLKVFSDVDNYCWDFESPKEFDISNDIPGSLAIFVLQKILDYFPDFNENEELNPLNELKECIKNCDIIFSKVLYELKTTEFRIIESVDVGIKKKIMENQMFKMFKNSREYLNLFYKVFRLFSYIKNHELYIEGITDTKHIKKLIFYSRAFSYFFSDNVFNNLKSKYVYVRIRNFDKSEINFDKLFLLCNGTKNFDLGCQKYILKYGIDDVNLYSKKYKHRLNLIINSVNEIEKNYIHLNWKLFLKLFPQVYSKINIIGEKEYYSFINKLYEDIVNVDFYEYTNFHVLYFDFLINTYLSKIFNMGSIWETKFKCMDLDDFKKMSLLTHYPIIVRICQTLWCVSYNCVIYFGNIFEVYLKFKNILNLHFNSEIRFQMPDENESREKIVKFKIFLK